VTLIVKKGQNGFLIGQIKEMPAVFTQGLTLEELRENIADALDMYLEDVRKSYKPDGEMLQEEELTFA
jgi:predicted RNase H-like HicB family nuclease